MKYNSDIKFKGLHTDTFPEYQPENTWRYAFNAQMDKSNFLSREQSNLSCGNIPDDYIIIGTQYIDDNETILFLVKKDNSSSIIAKIDINCKYTELVNSNCLGFKVENQIDSLYRLRRGCEKVIYFTAKDLSPKFIDTSNIQQYLKEESDNLPEGEKFDCTKMDLIKNPSTLPIINAEIKNSGGRLNSGSYNFGIIYLDEDYNETNVIEITPTINIYNDDSDSSYSSIYGSINNNVSNIFEITPTNKSIVLNISNIDSSFPYYSIVIFEASSGTGDVNLTFKTEPISSSEEEFILSSTQGLKKIDKYSTTFDSLQITSAEHIEQLDNRLFLANTKGVKYPICSYQPLASKIKTEFITEDVNAYNIERGNDKDGLTSFYKMNFQSNEVYSFGVVFVFTNNYHSPVYHIPGIAPNDYDKEKILDWNENISPFYSEDEYNNLPIDDKLERWEVENTSPNAQNVKYKGAMQYWESKKDYPERKNCSILDYWGKDYYGNNLTGTPIRHHRFPDRIQVPLVDNDATVTTQNGFYFNLWLEPDEEFPPVEYFELQIDYIMDSVQKTVVRKIYPSDIGLDLLVEEIVGTFDEDDVVFTFIPAGYVQNFTPTAVILPLDTETFKSGVITLLGVKFSNIEYPEGAIGHYFVAGIRDKNNRLVADSGIYNDTVENNKYIVSSRFVNRTEASVPTEQNREIIYITNPLNRMVDDKVSFDYLSKQAEYQPNYTLYNNTGIVQDVVDGSSSRGFLGIKFDQDGWSWITGFRWSDYKYFTTNNKLYKAIKKTNLIPMDSNDGFDDIKKLYNTAYDDKQLICKLDRDIDVRNGWEDLSIGYGNMMINQDVHDNLDNIKYRKISPILNINSNNEIFGGDTYISNITMIRSQFYESNTKKRWLETILKVFIIIALAALTIVSAGAAAPALAGAITGFTILSATLGVTAELMMAFHKELQRGLNLVYQDADLNSATPGDDKDDTLRYYGEVVSSIFIESEVPMGLRTNQVKSCTDFLRKPSIDNIKDYFKRKYLFPDESRDMKDSLKPIPCPETYYVNKDYLRQNEIKIYHSLPSTFDCCSECIDEFPNRIFYSEQAFQEERFDNYSKIKPNNYIDINGNTGEITDLWTYYNTLFIHTEDGLYKQPRNLQERQTNELTTYIGTGELFAIPPMKIIDDDGNSAGASHKWGTIKTPHGVTFISERFNKIYNFNGKLNPISSIGEEKWSNKNIHLKANRDYNLAQGEDLPFYNNPNSPVGLGFTSGYDKENNRVIITKMDFSFDEFYLYNDFKIVQMDGRVYLFNEWTALVASQESLGFTFKEIKDNKAIFVKEGELQEITYVDTLENGDTVTHKSYYPTLEKKEILPTSFGGIICRNGWTKSFDFRSNFWVSYHRYRNVYFETDSNLYSWNPKMTDIFKHQIPNKFGKFNNNFSSFIVEYTSRKNPFEISTWESIKIHAQATSHSSHGFNLLPKTFFTSFYTYNSYQLSNKAFLRVKEMGDDYLTNQITDDYNNVKVDKDEEVWAINHLRDSLISPDTQMFDVSCPELFAKDKIIRSDSLVEKDWFEKTVFRDNHLNIRLFFDSEDESTKLTLKAVTELINKSIR